MGKLGGQGGSWHVLPLCRSKGRGLQEIRTSEMAARCWQLAVASACLLSAGSHVSGGWSSIQWPQGHMEEMEGLGTNFNPKVLHV